MADNASVGVVYSAVRLFGPPDGRKWDEYIEWSGLTHLNELVSLDSILCPSCIRELTDEDWDHNIHADFQTHLFRNLDYLLRRIAGFERVTVLAILQNPSELDIKSFNDTRFVFRGFELLDKSSGISALSNCGGFEKVFVRSDLSEFGLLIDHAQASEVRTRLKVEYPDEHHADCNVWAVWQMTGTER